MKILAIETSCDETGLALLETTGGLRAPKIRVIKNIVASQIAIHSPFGGVVPNLAKREHLKNLPILFSKLMGKNFQFPISNFQKSWGMKIDLIAVTVGPGLEPALWTGITFAKELWRKFKVQNPNVKLVGANHLEGHLYSFLLSQKTANTKSETLNSKKLFPAIALIVSGGHTILLAVDSLAKWRMLGETRDDAVGEAFDKVARILDLPYPGGPEVERLAARGNPDAIPFPRPMIHEKSYDFSFSGLKTAVLYHKRDNPRTPKEHIAASFQAAVGEVLVMKTMRAVRKYGARTVLLSGGVAANRSLRAWLAIASRAHGAIFYAPPFKYNTDNAAMIGAAGYFAYLRKKRFPLRANGTLSV